MDGSFGWLRRALLARAAARVFAGKPPKRLSGPDDWIEGQDALSWRLPVRLYVNATGQHRL